MDNEEPKLNLEAPTSEPCRFSLTAARDVLSRLNALRQLESEAKQETFVWTLEEFQYQLESIEIIYQLQTSLALEYGLYATLAEGCTTTVAISNTAEAHSDPGNAATYLRDIFSVTDALTDREHVLALTWQTNCPQEVIRKELHEFQKAVTGRLNRAAKRAKLQDSPDAPPAQVARITSPFSSPEPHSASVVAPIPGPVPHTRKSRFQQHQLPPLPPQQQQSGAVAEPVFDERLYCLDETEDATVKTQLAKLATLLNPGTGGIANTPISVVGVFQQLMSGCADWRVRRGALDAMMRSSVDVQWRLLQNSRVLDCLTAWLQDALADHQVTMLRLLLGTLACLPMRRDLLKGSRLEAALERLTGERERVEQQRQGGGAAAAADGPLVADMRRMFAATAAAVLMEWRREPDHATILRRAGGAASEAPAPTTATMRLAPETPAASISSGSASRAPAPPPPLPGSRLLGAAAAAKDGLRKRTAFTSRPLAGEAARAAPRPRMMDAGATAGAAVGDGDETVAVAAAALGNGLCGGGICTDGSGIVMGHHSGGGGGGESGDSSLKKRAPLKAAAPAVSAPKQILDMTAKLGEKGLTDPDVVAGFRSRVGNGPIRRSQLTRPAKAPDVAPSAATANTAPRDGTTGLLSPAIGAGAALGDDVVTAGPATFDPLAPPSAAAGGGGGVTARELEGELDADDVARLRAERTAQRQAVALAALQVEARRLPEVAEAELEHQDRLRGRKLATRQQETVSAEEQGLRQRLLEALREVVKWSGPPPELRLPLDNIPVGQGEESSERQERMRAREHCPKVRYLSPSQVPDSPIEPPPLPAPSRQYQPQLSATRIIPWLPDRHPEDGVEWSQQNLRQPNLVLPPALLHKHSDLDAKLLPPQSAVPAAPVAPGHTQANGLFPPSLSQHPPVQSQPHPSPQRKVAPVPASLSSPPAPSHPHPQPPPPRAYDPLPRPQPVTHNPNWASRPGPVVWGNWGDTACLNQQPAPPPAQMQPPQQQSLNEFHTALAPLPPVPSVPLGPTPMWEQPGEIRSAQPLLKPAPPVMQLQQLTMPVYVDRANVSAQLVVLPSAPQLSAQPSEPQVAQPLTKVPYAYLSGVVLQPSQQLPYDLPHDQSGYRDVQQLHQQHYAQQHGQTYYIPPLGNQPPPQSYQDGLQNGGYNWARETTGHETAAAGSVGSAGGARYCAQHGQTSDYNGGWRETSDRGVAYGQPWKFRGK